MSASCFAPEDILTPVTPWARHTIADHFSGADGVRLGDVNDDGHMDLVVPWEASGVVTVHLNPGPHRARQRWPSVQVGTAGAVEDAVFVDLDGDGNLDVVSCSEGSIKTMHVHWAPADRTRYLDPSAWHTEPIPVTQGARKWMFCEAAQIDRKNGTDLFAGAKGDNGQVGWLEAPANPRDLSAWQWHALTGAGWPMSLIAADVDQDGMLDLLVSDRKGATRGCYWLRNPGPGSLRTLPWPVQRIDAGQDEIMFMDVGDLDGDDRADVVAATNRRELVWYRQADLPGTTWTASRMSWPERFGTGKSVRLADIDLDGQTDIVFACENAGGKFGVGWLSRQLFANADLRLAQPISGTAGDKFDLVQTLDLDDDGDLDVLTCEESAGLGVVWYENMTVSSIGAMAAP